ncbi:hypothetical protein PAMH27_5161 [Pseudomonas aeruginosa MH27]|nr:hypothetical protein PAMH27_5161 [Pseudomonas aeruginosa MH27]
MSRLFEDFLGHAPYFGESAKHMQAKLEGRR